MKPIKHVLWELLLMLSSVLIFRSLWLMMDSVINLNSTEFLLVFFLVGIVLAGVAFFKLTHAD